MKQGISQVKTFLLILVFLFYGVLESRHGINELVKNNKVSVIIKKVKRSLLKINKHNDMYYQILNNIPSTYNLDELN